MRSCDDKDDVWAIVELMGHVKLAGRITEEEKFGAKMGRLDIPDGDGFVTQMFGGGGVYRVTIVTEAVARQVCKQTAPAPVSPWDFPKQLAAPAEAYQGGEQAGYAADAVFDDDDDERTDDEDHPY